MALYLYARWDAEIVVSPYSRGQRSEVRGREMRDVWERVAVVTGCGWGVPEGETCGRGGGRVGRSGHSARVG